MSENKPSTSWVDPDDAPEITADDLRRATHHIAGKEVTRAAFRQDLAERPPDRPAMTAKRPMLSMRVDVEVLARLRASGKGWQTRVNALLKEAVEQGRL
jgi:uncharacterized protein (DUF4415 family)